MENNNAVSLVNEADSIENKLNSNIDFLKEYYDREILFIAKQIQEKIKREGISTEDNLESAILEAVSDSEFVLFSNKMRMVFLCSENWDAVCSDDLFLALDGKVKPGYNGNTKQGIKFSFDYLPLEQIVTWALIKDVYECLCANGFSLEDQDENEELEEIIEEQLTDN